MTEAERQKLGAKLRPDYEQGKSIRTLAAEADRSYGFIHRALSDAGVNFRSRGGANRDPQAKVRKRR
jgi:predicted transcriptional regulator